MSRKPRIYHPHLLAIDTIISLEPEAAQHITRVLRMKLNDQIIVFNNEGGEYLGIIESIKNKTDVKLIHYININRESPLIIHLAQGLARSDRMDFIIQKATELGVTHITPLTTTTSVVKLDAKKTEKKIQHWQNIIISAAQQSGRTRLPVLNEPISFQKFMTQPFEGKNILFDPLSNKHLNSIAPQPKALRIIIGPESGLSEVEISLALANQFESYTLGPRILRTETASIAALSMIQTLYGDF